MSDERWPRVKALFQAVVERPAEERDAFLAAETSGDEPLRRDVESLLAADTSDVCFLDRLPVARESVLADPLTVPRASMDHTLSRAALYPGHRVGPYQVVGPIGAGGMGEVYRARDTKLNRDVALKVLPELFALDPDRLARFTREAQLLATLNHPNIAAIYGLEESNSSPGSGQAAAQALVLELVDGPTLADRITRGPLSLEEALPIARQIAEALEAAHEKGVIHRDLKPANIKIREDGTVKVLDFGLAKALDPASGARLDAMISPAAGELATAAHVILGTAAYMSPEQARGRPVDKRTDIWAFGVVVFEMLAGQRLFSGETISDTLASVLKTDPNWRALPAAVPPGLRRLLRWCLEKDPKRRLQAIGDARVQIEDLLGGVPDDTAATPSAVPRQRIIVAAGAVFVAGAALTGLFSWTLTRPAPATLQPVRFAIVPPAAEPLKMTGSFGRYLAMSPDGTQLAYASDDGRLMVRAIDQLDAVPLGGITGASAPFFSPDGRWIGFFSGTIGGEIKKVSITGGPPVSLARAQGNSAGASWGPDDTIVFSTFPSAPSVGLLRVPAAGGEPTVLTTPDTAHGEQNHLFPSVLPGGRAVLFTITSTSLGSIENAQVAMLDLTTGQRKTLIRGGSQAEYVAPSKGSAQAGHLVYMVAGTLRAVRFDPVKLEVLSDPVPVVESGKALSNGVAAFSISRQGTLAYVPSDSLAGATQSLVWVDRHGHEEPIAAPPRAYLMPRLSPDGTRVAVYINDQDLDMWIWDLARRTLTRLTDAPGTDWYPVWTPDGRRIVFTSERVGGGNHSLFSQAADNTGTAEQLLTNPAGTVGGPASISRDGTRLIVMQNMPKTGWDLGLLRLDSPAGGPRPPEPLVQTTATELFGEVSPDGRWLAYQSDESGQNQIWVRPFPNVDGGHWQISTSGGITPVWTRNGKELIYLDRNNAVISVPIQTAPTFSAGAPTKLFDGGYVGSPFWRTYDVSADGQRFLMIKANNAGNQPSAPASMVVVINWFEELKRLVPSK